MVSLSFLSGLGMRQRDCTSSIASTLTASSDSVMSSSDDDEDLKRAIALSLEDSNTGKTAHEAISIDSDSNTATNHPEKDLPTELSKGLPDWLVGLPMSASDRRRMEQKRLDRKRKASPISPPPIRRAMKNGETASTANQAKTPISNSKGPLYLTGTVKKTWALCRERKGDDIKLEEVLQKDDLKLAVLSSFQWDMHWLLAKINTKDTNITLVMQANNLATQQQYRQETEAITNLRLCFPSMEGQISSMHSKLMLLAHPTHLRVAVPTANLVSYDWGETALMENMIFLIDLPRLPEGQRTTKEDMTSFGTELIYFLEAMGLEHSIIDSIYYFDYTATKDLAFIHSIGGEHSGESWQRTGYCGLGQAVKQLGLGTEKPLHIDCVTSSLGALNDDFLAMLYLSAQGDNGLKEYTWRNPPVVSKKKKAPQEDSQEDSQPIENSRERLLSHLRDRFHVYFPTHNTVKKSLAGFAGTICFRSNWYNSPSFPREVLRECISVRRRMLMHNKMLLVRTEDDPSISWAYVGSANCSEAAWGKLVKDGATEGPKLNCRNWECGVLLPARWKAPGVEEGDLNGSERIIPVPMKIPGREYGDNKPWFFREQRRSGFSQGFGGDSFW